MTERLSGFTFSPLRLWQALRRASPHLVQVDEEPASVALLQVLLLKRMLGYKVMFFTWENLTIRYPWPFEWIRWLNLKLADGAMAGTQGAATVLRQAGYAKPLAIIPQLGVDPAHSAPQRAEDLRNTLGLKHFTVGYVGRLVPEKGLMVLLQALQQLDGDWQCLIVGRGPLRPELEQRAQELGMAERIVWLDTVPHQDVPRYVNALDVLVLPSQSTPRWKEQLGHVLLEAMACGVPVIGSDCGAIPDVVGQAGLVFPEGQADVLAEHLRHLRENEALRRNLSLLGRERVLADFTHQRIAERTVAFWREICPCK
jgi:glycosyltransferase involved in cell wall biosynthesis